MQVWHFRISLQKLICSCMNWIFSWSNSWLKRKKLLLHKLKRKRKLPLQKLKLTKLSGKMKRHWLLSSIRKKCFLPKQPLLKHRKLTNKLWNRLKLPSYCWQMKNKLVWMVYKRKSPMQNKQWTRQCMDIQRQKLRLNKGLYLNQQVHRQVLAKELGQQLLLVLMKSILHIM